MRDVFIINDVGVVEKKCHDLLPGFCMNIGVERDAISWTGKTGGRIGLERERMWKARGRIRSRVQLQGIQLTISECRYQVGHGI